VPFFDELMKIVLVFPPFYLEPMYNLPPLGLINLATVLKGSVHQVVIIDFVLAIRRGTLRMSKDIYKDCAHEILNEEPDLIGFSAQCTTYPGVIRISKEIKKKRNDVKIVIGGHNASFVDEVTLDRFPFVDAVVRGEGEITFKKLVDCYESGEKPAGVAGVTFRMGAKIIRNKDRDLIPDLDEKGWDKAMISKEWDAVSHVDAVSEGRVYVFGEDYVVIPGPRFILILEKMARLIHPEVDW